MKLRISLVRQCLELTDDGGTCLRRYAVSTARNGPGELSGSHCTPRGRHRIRAKIGHGQPSGAIFVGRRPTGEIHTPELDATQPDRDWILTRILWLCGCEPGRNRFGPVDTMRRYIYIHGTSATAAIGTPASHGCIRMRNADLLELFDLVDVGTGVEISEE